MASTNDDDVVERGRTLYEERLRATIEPGNTGKFLVIDVDTGEYELDANDLVASKRARVRFPSARLFMMRVGHPAAYRLGGRFRAAV